MIRVSLYAFNLGRLPVQQELGIELTDRKVGQAAQRAVSAPRTKQENATPPIDMAEWAKKLN